MTANKATQKELKELYISACKVAYPRLTMTPRDLGFIIETECGELIHVEKPQIEKRFCYADHLEHAHEYARRVCTEEEFFISENTADLRRTIEELENDETFWIIPREETPIICTLRSGRYHIYPHEKRLVYALPDEDRARALEVYRMALVDFEKRLRSYVKRYGLKKVHSWTYWADA